MSVFKYFRFKGRSLQFFNDLLKGRHIQPIKYGINLFVNGLLTNLKIFQVKAYLILPRGQTYLVNPHICPIASIITGKFTINVHWKRIQR